MCVSMMEARSNTDDNHGRHAELRLRVDHLQSTSGVPKLRQTEMEARQTFAISCSPLASSLSAFPV